MLVSTHVLSTLLATALPPTAIQSPIFKDVTAHAGLQFQQREVTRRCKLYSGFRCQMEHMSGGVAVGDANGDGWQDLYLTSVDGPDRLYLNDGDGTFSDGTAAKGLDRDAATNGAAFADVDGDGDQDLIVTVFAPATSSLNNHHQLWIQDAAGVFHEEAVSRGFSSPSPSGMNGWGIATGDINRDGWVDVVITQWAPDAPSGSQVLLNRGSAAPGHFDAGPHPWSIDLTGIFSFAATLTDLDGDGWQDLAIVGDFGTSRLYWNEGPMGFVDGTVAAGVGTDENGMGSAFGDIDGDGDLDWFVTSIYDAQFACAGGACGWGDSGNRLFRNDGGRTFTDITDDRGVREGAWGWGATFLDFDNDSDLDLVQTNGVRFPNVAAFQFYRDPTRFWVQVAGGDMIEASERVGITDTGSGKGVVTLDYDRDGDLDVLITQNSNGPILYRNDAATEGHWLRVTVEGTLTNRDALGAVVEVTAGGRTQRQEVGTGAHFLGQPELELHFGLGASALVERVEVEFPASGIRHVLTNVGPDQRIAVTE